MSIVMHQYEQDMKTPISGLITGNLVHGLLIQVGFSFLIGHSPDSGLFCRFKK